MALWHENLTSYNNARNMAMDSRFAQSSYPNANNVQRGRIENIRVTATGAVADKRHVFHFLTNPSEISLGYDVNTSIDFTDPANASMMDMPTVRDGLLTVGFEVLLDRTYEVWSGTLEEGVLHDIAQLEKVLGMPDIVVRPTDSTEAAAARNGPPTASMFPGVIVKRPVRILFGGRKAFSFDGYITNLSVTLMKFNSRMCPTRAGLRIDATSWGDKIEDGGDISSGSRGWQDIFDPNATAPTNQPRENDISGIFQLPGGP